jgi:hypothetical protein
MQAPEAPRCRRRTIALSVAQQAPGLLRRRFHWTSGMPAARSAFRAERILFSIW